MVSADGFFAAVLAQAKAPHLLRNPSVSFHAERRSNTTHTSTTDPLG